MLWGQFSLIALLARKEEQTSIVQSPHKTSLNKNTGRLYSTGLCIEPYTFRLKSGVSQVVWLLWREKSGSLLWEPQKTVLTYCLNQNCFEDLLTKEIMKPDTVSNKERQQNRITLSIMQVAEWHCSAQLTVDSHLPLYFMFRQGALTLQRQSW